MVKLALSFDEEQMHALINIPNIVFTPCTRIVRFCYNVFRRPGFMPVINEYHGASSKQLLQKSVPISMLRIFRAGAGTATLELWHMLWGTPVSRLEAKMHA